MELLFGGRLPSAVPGADEGESSAENNTSLAMRVTCGGLSVFIAGDAEPDEQQLMVNEKIDVRAGVWKMPHHGSARQSPDLWGESGASVAVASAGLHNDYGHPAPSALRLATRLGMTVARTDQQGSIAMAGDGGEITIRTLTSSRG